MIALDNLRFAMAIHTGQYTSFVCFDTISFIICFIKFAEQRQRNVVLAEIPMFLFNCCHSTLFLLTSFTTIKNYMEAKCELFEYH